MAIGSEVPNAARTAGHSPRHLLRRRPRHPASDPMERIAKVEEHSHLLWRCKVASVNVACGVFHSSKHEHMFPMTGEDLPERNSTYAGPDHKGEHLGQILLSPNKDPRRPDVRLKKDLGRLR